MSAPSLARQLRMHFADLLQAVDTDAPTLCQGWTARDLAAHVVVRDRRPDALPGVLIKAFAGHTENLLKQRAAMPFVQTVDLVRQGAPAWSIARIPAVDQRMNTAEFLIHAEDVRRAQDSGPELPALPAGSDAAAWDGLKGMAAFALRSCPVTVKVDCPGFGQATVHTAKDSDRSVTLFGSPVDVLLLISGRSKQDATVNGEPDTVEEFKRQTLGF